METDQICIELIEIETESRKLRARFTRRRKRWNPSAVPLNGGRPKGTPDKPASRRKYKKVKNSRYQQCVDDGICTVCQTTKAERGRLCDGCYEKERERMKKRILERSGRRAACRQKREAA